MINELETIVLTEDIPSHELQRGDVGVVVHVYHNPQGYEVEFVTLGGDTIAVVTLSPFQVRLAGKRELLHVRAVV